MLGKPNGIASIGRKGWNPTVPANPVLWLDANQGITVVSGKVSQWVCRQTGQILAQSSSALRPAYSATAWNGAKPGVQFGSAYTSLTNTTGSIVTFLNGSNVPFTVAFTANITTRSLVQTILAWFLIGDSSGFTYFVDSTNKDGVDFTSGGIPQVGSVVCTGANKRMAFERGSVSGSSYVNTAVSLNNISTGATISGQNLFAIGGNELLGATPVQMTITELLIWNIKLTANDFYRYEGYSGLKWGT